MNLFPIFDILSLLGSNSQDQRYREFLLALTDAISLPK